MEKWVMNNMHLCAQSFQYVYPVTAYKSHCSVGKLFSCEKQKTNINKLFVKTFATLLYACPFICYKDVFIGSLKAKNLYAKYYGTFFE